MNALKQLVKVHLILYLIIFLIHIFFSKKYSQIVNIYKKIKIKKHA